MRDYNPRSKALRRNARRHGRQGPPADLHASLAQPLPGTGDLRPARGAVFRPGPLPDLGRSGRLLPDDTASMDGMAALLEYGLELVAVKRAEPADDVISRLCDEPDLTDLEVATLGMQLLFAGL